MPFIKNLVLPIPYLFFLLLFFVTHLLFFNQINNRHIDVGRVTLQLFSFNRPRVLHPCEWVAGVGNSPESSYTLVRPGQNLPISPLIESFGISRISLESRIFVHPSCELPTPGEWVYSRRCGTYALFPVPPGGFNFTHGWMPGRISQD